MIEEQFFLTVDKQTSIRKAVFSAAIEEVDMKKKDKIQKLLAQGNSPYAIHKLIGVNVCYVQKIKAEMEVEMWKQKYYETLEHCDKMSEVQEQQAA